MVMQMPCFAVNGYEVSGLEQAEHQLQLLAPCVAGNMHIRKPVIDDVRSALEELIYDPSDALFVAGYCGSGDNNGIALADDELVVSIRHTEKPAHGFALAAGRQYADALGLVAFELFKGYHPVLGDMKIAEILCYFGDNNHRAPLEADYPVMCDSDIADLLYPVNI